MDSKSAKNRTIKKEEKKESANKQFSSSYKNPFALTLEIIFAMLLTPVNSSTLQIDTCIYIALSVKET